MVTSTVEGMYLFAAALSVYQPLFSEVIRRAFPLQRVALKRVNVLLCELRLVLSDKKNKLVVISWCNNAAGESVKRCVAPLFREVVA